MAAARTFLVFLFKCERVSGYFLQFLMAIPIYGGLFISLYSPRNKSLTFLDTLYKTKEGFYWVFGRWAPQ